MTKNKLLVGMLVLFVATALQSQQPSKRMQTDSVRKDSAGSMDPVLPAPVDSNEILKKQINSVNTDIYKTADRIDYKIGRLPVMVQRAVVYKNRVKPEVSSIQPSELPVSVPQPTIDTLQDEQVSSRFMRFFKRKK